jgi:hypothetical protein
MADNVLQRHSDLPVPDIEQAFSTCVAKADRQYNQQV